MRTYALVIAFLSAALFGAATPASKMLLKSFSEFQLAGILYLGGVIGVLPTLLLDYKNNNLRDITGLTKKNLLNLLGAIFFGGVIAPIFLLIGLNLASSSSVSMWLNLEVVATAILGYFLFKDHLDLNQWIAITGITITGILLSIGEGATGIRAGIFITIACIAWGLDNHMASLVDDISPSQSTFFKGIIAGSVNLTLGLITHSYTASWNMLLFALLVGAFSYGISIALHISASQQLGATRVQMIFSTAPFFGIILSAIFLKESLSSIQVLSAFILTISLIVLFKGKHHHEHTHEKLEHNHMHRHDDGHHNHTHEGLPKNTRHSHSHQHEPLTHTHAHLPDIHHRHSHSH